MELLVSFYSSTNLISTNLIIIISALVSIGFFLFALYKIKVRFNARSKVENILKYSMIAASCVAIITTIGIVLSLIIETIEFFKIIRIRDFLFGLQWSPQIALREDQVAGQGLFGAVPIFLGTILITLIAMIVAVPVGLLSAIYLSEYSNPKVRAIAKPMLEVLAGIPTVVYGFFAALTVAPFLRNNGASLGLSLSSESALAAGLVMGIMIIPLISSLSDDIINAVPQSLREGSAALGSTQSETVKFVILPAALPGIVSAILLALSRAIGETMIVVMAAGVAANLTFNPFESVTAVTVQIVVLLIGDQEFDSAKTLAAFALGFTLFIITLLLNILSIYIVRKYREQYD
jgi:phosphate transport system permease protein